ncbi:hypothetical protein [Actinocatenispora rupis]|uniref:Mycothiol maleylpyruvate isomerase N-terminal domain-containing protein n=1 Tax=Actinocatenispora rupis TaxID=519421 RepID=A0A8J3ND10_9ACTN|nr:hypothetical protein [Actinocatenispora rupis]GID14571.1 hypothetical protein Aru02nite_54600 [Actinocatenispora rupis]
MTGERGARVTADDVALAVRLAVATLRTVADRDWSVPAGSLDWDCWETVEHLADDLFSYATQLSAVDPPQTSHVRVAWRRERPGGPASVIYAERDAGTAGLIQVVDACGGLLTAVVRTADPTVTAHHVYGNADPEGFAAMGVVETVAHMHDVAQGLGAGWEPPAELCDRALTRLFPDAPTDTDRYRTLLWATGRAELPGRPRLTDWRWYGEPRG